MPIVDSHCHIYPEKIAAKAVASIGHFYDIPMTGGRGTPQALLEEHRQAGITHAIIHSVATTPQQVRSINRFIAETMHAHPEHFTGLGTLHPLSEDMRGDIENLTALGLHGVKLHPDFQRFALDDPLCDSMFSICQDLDLPVLIHTGDRRYDYSNPNRLIPMLRRFNRLRVIGAHFGGWSMWEEAAEDLYPFRNLWVDTSSSLYAISPQAGARLVRLYGAERCMFGTDFPMWEASDELKRFDAMGLNAQEREQVLYKTACQVFNLRV